MSAPVTYTAIRDGRIALVTPEPGSEAERKRWRELGVDVHQKMDAAIAEARLSLPEHPDDDEHNIAVGRATEMIAAGHVREGADFYCAWASAHGYPGVSIISFDKPLQLDIGTAIGGMVAELRDGEITILTAGDWVRPGYSRVDRSFWVPTHLWGKLILPVRA